MATIKGIHVTLTSEEAQVLREALELKEAHEKEQRFYSNNELDGPGAARHDRAARMARWLIVELGL